MSIDSAIDLRAASRGPWRRRGNDPLPENSSQGGQGGAAAAAAEATGSAPSSSYRQATTRWQLRQQQQQQQQQQDPLAECASVAATDAATAAAVQQLFWNPQRPQQQQLRSRSCKEVKRPRIAKVEEEDDDDDDDRSAWREESETDEAVRLPRSKALREKARRERINERFAELAKLCDPEDPKSDKASILADAIKVLNRIKVENGQLKQLNKFLEERAGQYEKEKGQQLYQQLLLQGGAQPVQQVAQPSTFHNPQVAVGLPIAGVGVGPSPLPPKPCPLIGVQPTHANLPNAVDPAMGMPLTLASNVVSSQPGISPSSSWAPLHGFHSPEAWVTVPDNAQADQLLRPPAA